jgi:hypothetical protein
MLVGMGAMMAIAMVVLVVDIGQVVTRGATNQSVADLAALSATKNLSVGNYTAACEDAVNYVNANAPDFDGVTASSFCSETGNDMDTTVCSGGDLAEAMPSATVGKYTISVHFPVPTSEIVDPNYGSGIFDASQCKRMRVIISTPESTLLGNIFGVSSITTTKSATVRTKQASAAVWLLDPTGCTPLTVSGGSQVTIGSSSPLVAGIVAIESDGSACGSNQYTISASGAGTFIHATPTTGTDQGMVRLVALPFSASTCSAPACNAADVTATRLSPQPVNGTRVGRYPVDWKYNCKSTYPTYHSLSVPACPNSGVTPAYIDDLVSAIGNTRGVLPSSYSLWSTFSSCNPTGTVTAPAGNWLIDCNGGLSIGNGTTVTIPSGNVILDGGLTMTGGAFNVNTANITANLPSSCIPPAGASVCASNSSAEAAYLYTRTGDWNLTGGSINLNHVMHYQANGYLKSSANPPTWLAPTEGRFQGLSYWSEASSNKFQIAGGSGVNLSGVFFTPEAAPFGLTGGGNWGQQRAQFISYQLAISGGSVASFAPDVTTAVNIPTAGYLIR